MAWRLTQFLLSGELDNAVPGRIRDYIKLCGGKGKVTISLEGDFHRDIRGAKIKFFNELWVDEAFARDFLINFRKRQTGEADDTTAGLPPQDYVPFPYIEWYSKENGRIVIELDPTRIEVVGDPVPACEYKPISREEQERNTVEYLRRVSEEIRISPERVRYIEVPFPGSKE